MLLSPRANITNPIRELEAVADEMIKKGEEVIKLNIGDPLRYDFQVPKALKESILRALEENHDYYAASQGVYELREVIGKREGVEAEDVVITAGVSEAILFLMGACIEKGTEVLVPGPTYPPYISYIKFFGGVPVEYKCDEQNGWQPDLDDLRRKINKKTAFIVVINPNNPTGAVYEKSTLLEILDIASEAQVPVISDEIYYGLTFEGKDYKLGHLARDALVIGFDGLSKRYLATGWRLGWIYFKGPEEQVGEIKKRVVNQARFRLSTCTPVQWATYYFLKSNRDLEHLADVKKKFRKRRDLVVEMIEQIPGLEIEKPKAAFYAFPAIKERRWKSDKEFAVQLLKEKKITVVHGSGFGNYGRWHFRLVYLAQEQVLEEAMRRIKEFMLS